MIKQGKAWKFGDDISTDHIAPGRLFHLRTNLPELAKHVLEDADHEFAQKMNPGDFVVAGSNFGLGSSREHAPQVLKIAGVNAVLAKPLVKARHASTRKNGSRSRKVLPGLFSVFSVLACEDTLVSLSSR